MQHIHLYRPPSQQQQHNVTTRGLAALAYSAHAQTSKEGVGIEIPKENMARYFGGIQGGGSHSDCVILNERGELVGSSSGPGTNPWAIGFDRAAEELATMVQKAKRDAGITQDKPLDSLGMALSGGEQEEGQRRITEGIKSTHPHTANLYHVCTDTFGSIATAFPKGGMVLISGTGSNCQLLNPSGSAPRCGGWGHILGDGGSGYWISHRAIQTVYDAEDGLVTPTHDHTAVKKLVFDHFKLEKRYDILDHLYEKFEKSHIATLCKPLAELARSGDKLAGAMFWDAGEILGAHVKALVPQSEEPFSQTPGGLHVVAVGSVIIHCWDLLREGFLSVVGEVVRELTVVKLCVSSAVGGAILGAQKLNLPLPVNYETHTSLLEHFKK